MSSRPHSKSRIKVCNKSVFHLQDKKADEGALSIGLIKSAKRSGQLSLSNRGLGTVPENVWKIDELVLDETKDVDFGRADQSNWWNAEALKTLDLSSNAIAVIPPDIKFLQSLVTLKLHDNALTSLPAEIGSLNCLSNVSLDRNKLVSLPIEFYRLTELRWLSISHNQLEKILPDIGDLVMLTFLDLSHNKITELPPGMGYLVRLVELKLSHNQLDELPPDIVNLRDLKKMDVSNNSLRNLPALGELRKMEILEANHNDIQKLPNFYGCTALKEIYLANNCITEITEDFCDQMLHLSVLNIRDNKLSVLPENVSLLQKLKRLDLSNNSLNKLPRNLGLLTQLQSISMEGNKLSFVRQDVLRGGSDRMMKFLRDRITDEVLADTRRTDSDWPDKYTMKKSQALMVPGRALAEVPEHVLEAAAACDVHIVDVSKNLLAELPPGMIALRGSLTQLVASSNALARLPGALGGLARLQLLDLARNRLADLPPDLAGLKQLRELNISNNKFTHVPPCVYSMESLEILLAAENRIGSIDVSRGALGGLARLAVLDLANNSLAAVPPALGTFTHLRPGVKTFADCFYNADFIENEAKIHLTFIQGLITDGKQLVWRPPPGPRSRRAAESFVSSSKWGKQTLELMGNLFRQPRHAVLAKGTASILSYLRDRIPKE